MEAKYYTPNLADFRVGFKYEKADVILFGERKDAKEWTKNVFSTETDSLTLQTIETLLNNGFIRVKCLDESDIIEAGWIVDEINNHDYHFDEDTFLDSLELVDNSHIIKIVKYGYDTLFYGYIRNYKELLDVMAMLNIKTK